MSTLIASSLMATQPTQELSWSPKVMMSTKIVSDVQVSPTQESVLFVVTEPKTIEEKEVPLSRIYKTSSDPKKRAIPFSAADVSSMQPRWSPDGQWIAFLSSREGSKNLYLIHAEGGEASALTKSKKGVQTFCWSPDSKSIAFVMADETAVEKHRSKTSLAYVYKHNSTVNRLWLIDVFSSPPVLKPLTSDEYCVRGYGDFGTANVEFDWAPDSKHITFAYSLSTGFDDFYLDSSLATIDVTTGKIIPLKKYSLYEGSPRYSPDGEWIAYLSENSSTRYSIDRQIAIRSSNGELNHFLSPTFNEGAFIAGPNLLGWTYEGDHLIFFEPKGTKSHLVLIPVDGSLAKEVETGEVFFKEPSLSYDRSTLGLIIQTPATPPEAFIAKVNDFTPMQVSHVNEQLLSYPKIETELISWQSSDGMSIEGLLTYPIGYEKGKQYPLLLVVHGGPMGVFDETFLGTPYPYPFASFAQEGFFIFRPNPRGSTGYGKSFRCANYKDWGGTDFIDIMTGVDACIAKGIVDPERLGIMGWSYGGYMTAWAITQTSRFKAASMGAGLANLVSMNGTTDLHRFLTDYLGDFTHNRALYEDRSPINYVSHVTTPCLIQHGTDDKRVPVSQAYEFYHALNRLGKKTTLILYPGMEHRLFDPKMQLDAMERNLSWFQQYLSN